MSLSTYESKTLTFFQLFLVLFDELQVPLGLLIHVMGGLVLEYDM